LPSCFVLSRSFFFVLSYSHVRALQPQQHKIKKKIRALILIRYFSCDETIKKIILLTHILRFGVLSYSRMCVPPLQHKIKKNTTILLF
jgi:hypothetical protein